MASICFNAQGGYDLQAGHAYGALIAAEGFWNFCEHIQLV